MLTKKSSRLHRSISTCNWTSTHTTLSSSSVQPITMDTEMDALHFLHEYLQNGNSDLLIGVLTKIAHEIQAIPFEQLQRSHSGSNNNHHTTSHLPLSPTYHSNWQLSYNKDKKNKKEKSDDKDKNEKKSTNGNKTKKDEKTKKENADEESGAKKSTKKKERVKQAEETTDTDVLEPPSPVSPTRTVPSSPMTPSFSHVDTPRFPTLSVPVPHSTISTGSSPVSPDPSRVNQPPEQANGYSVAQLSQIQQQLQSDPQNSPSKVAHPPNRSVQEQLQSLSQMARDGDEILITLSVNALTQKQKTNSNAQNHPPTSHHQQPQSFQNNPYHSPTPWNNLYHQAMPPPPPAVIMPRNVEIVAKGFARVQNEQPPLPPSNAYTQQSMVHPHNQPPYAMMQPFYAPRFPMPCYSSSGPPQIPLGPPIQPILGSSNMMMMAGGLTRPPNAAGLIPGMQNSFEDSRNRLRVGGHSTCDYLCQSSMYQPDFRGRPPPGAIANASVYNNNNIISPQLMSFSAGTYREKSNHLNSKRSKDSINEPRGFFHHRTH